MFGRIRDVFAMFIYFERSASIDSPVAANATVQREKLHRGAEEACWAHNPKVLGSKPSGARYSF